MNYKLETLLNVPTISVILQIKVRNYLKCMHAVQWRHILIRLLYSSGSI